MLQKPQNYVPIKNTNIYFLRDHMKYIINYVALTLALTTMPSIWGMEKQFLKTNGYCELKNELYNVIGNKLETYIADPSNSECFKIAEKQIKEFPQLINRKFSNDTTLLHIAVYHYLKQCELLISPNSAGGLQKKVFLPFVNFLLNHSDIDLAACNTEGKTALQLFGSEDTANDGETTTFEYFHLLDEVHERIAAAITTKLAQKEMSSLEPQTFPTSQVLENLSPDAIDNHIIGDATLIPFKPKSADGTKAISMDNKQQFLETKAFDQIKTEFYNFIGNKLETYIADPSNSKCFKIAEEQIKEFPRLINRKFSNGTTLLHIAVYHYLKQCNLPILPNNADGLQKKDFLSFINFLLNHPGIDLDVCNAEGKTALQLFGNEDATAKILPTPHDMVPSGYFQALDEEHDRIATAIITKLAQQEISSLEPKTSPTSQFFENLSSDAIGNDNIICDETLILFKLRCVDGETAISDDEVLNRANLKHLAILKKEYAFARQQNYIYLQKFIAHKAFRAVIRKKLYKTNYLLCCADAKPR